MHLNTKSLEKVAFWLALLMPLSISLEVFVIGEANFILLIILGVIYFFAGKKFEFLQEKWVKAFFLLWGYMLLRSLFADDALISLKRTLPFGQFIFFVFAMQALTQYKEADHKKIFYVLAIALAFLAIDGFFQYFTGKDFLFGRPLADEGIYYRITGPYKKKVFGAILAILSMPVIAITFFYFRQKKTICYLYLLLSILIYAAVMLSGERAALLQITFGTGVILLLYLLYERKSFSYRQLYLASIVLVLIIAVTAFIFQKYSAVLTRQVYSVIDIAKNFSDSVYGRLWISGIKIGADNPIFGVGGNHFSRYCSVLHSEICTSSHPCKHPHSLYIEFFAEYGIIGLGLFLYFIYSIAAKIYDFYKSNKLNTFHSFLLLGVTIALIQILLPLPSSTFSRRWFAIPIWFMIGWAISIIEMHRHRQHR
jgi:O-antigen ligase